MALATLTYGVLPAQSLVFKAVGEEGFTVNLNGRDEAILDRAFAVSDLTPPSNTSEWTAAEVWGVLQALSLAWDAGQEEAGDLASSILTVLGFEWV